MGGLVEQRLPEPDVSKLASRCLNLAHAAGSKSRGKAPSTGNTAGNAAAGTSVFAQNCATCHGATGRGGNGGPDLTTIPSAKTLSVVVRQVTNGGGGMPAFSGTLTQTQIDDVAAYVVQSITNKK